MGVIGCLATALSPSSAAMARQRGTQVSATSSRTRSSIRDCGVTVTSWVSRSSASAK